MGAVRMEMCMMCGSALFYLRSSRKAETQGGPLFMRLIQKTGGKQNLCFPLFFEGKCKEE